MKHLAILMVTLVMLVKPLWPIMEYVANYDYIANVLCENRDKPKLQCNGKCYLAKQLEKEQKERDKNPFGEQRSKIEVQSMDYFQSLLNFDLALQIEVYSDNNFCKYQDLNAMLLIEDITHPPELI
jgi:hypothetical protein